MALKTPLTEILGIEHPVICAPMALVTGGKLAAAVSAAGGLGLIGGGYGDRDWLTREMAAAGNARIGVGFITWSLAKKPELLDLALEHSPAAIMLSFGDEIPFAGKAKAAGAKLICQVQTVAQARHAAAAGADVIVAQGTEAGGHGAARGSMALIPAVVDAVAPIPVVAAGGIADGRGLAAALMLGAAGVLIGTRFYASAESLAHAGAKQRLAETSGDRTLRGHVFDAARRMTWPKPYSFRTLANDFSDTWAGREAELVADDSTLAAYAQAATAGDFDTAAVVAGEAADLIHDSPPAARIVTDMVAAAESLLAGGGKWVG